MHSSLRKILQSAYRCEGFDSPCTSMRWDPDSGHIPRGYYGALGQLNEVRLIMVLAEPAEPGNREIYIPGTPDELMDDAFHFAERCYTRCYDWGYRGRQFEGHRNARDIISRCFPGIPFPDVMSKVWITESVLCSARKSGASVAPRIEKHCVQHYLVRQLDLFPNAIIGLMGFSKAVPRVQKFAPEFFDEDRVVECDAIFARKSGFQPSWENLVRRVRNLREG